ncbi:MAG: 4-(cytidine 5'-diphospho)-2-C-methyl-D-erythritol kinase, partial [Lachnospiraceae bacterium]|nr:4-(cytidine 5'-diphospho)-2-C-methyl-D-erythritol kinase [Lachnospiraceae bacterium]
RLENVMETVTAARYEVIGDIRRQLLNAGALNAVMSGSGPTVFGIFDTRQKAELAKEAVVTNQLAGQVFVAHFC